MLIAIKTLTDYLASFERDSMLMNHNSLSGNFLAGVKDPHAELVICKILLKLNQHERALQKIE